MVSYTLLVKDSGLVLLALRGKGRRITVSTKIKGDASRWDASAHRFTGPYSIQLNALVRRWEDAATEEILTGETDLSLLRDAIQRRMGDAPSQGRPGVLAEFRRWAVESDSRHTANRQTLYSSRLFAEFLGGKDIPFARVTYEFSERYIAWMRDVKGLSPNTRGIHIQWLKAVMEHARKKGLHDNTAYRGFVKEREEVDNIYLTDDELAAIADLELPPMLDKARDLLLVGCYTALRWSDFSQLGADNARDGYLRVITQKTGERVVIPLHPKVRQILDKWDGVPRLAAAVFNRSVKEVCRLAGMTHEVEVYRHGRKQKLPRWELVSSHTARRTAATNMYKAGIPTISIMKITGHRTEAAFMRYIRISKEENAAMLADNPFFNPK